MFFNDPGSHQSLKTKENKTIKRHGEKAKSLGDMQTVLWCITRIRAWSSATDWLFTTSEKNPSNCCCMQDHNQCCFKWTWGIQLIRNFLIENFTVYQCKFTDWNTRKLWQCLASGRLSHGWRKQFSLSLFPWQLETTTVPSPLLNLFTSLKLL